MIEHNIIAAKNYAYIVIKQSPGLDAFLSASKIFVADPDFSADIHRLCDFSQADLSHIKMEQLIAYAEFAKAHIPMTKHTKVALVAPGESKMGLFETFTDSVQIGNFRIFQAPEDAVIWINESQAAHPLMEGEFDQ